MREPPERQSAELAPVLRGMDTDDEQDEQLDDEDRERREREERREAAARTVAHWLFED